LLEDKGGKAEAQEIVQIIQEHSDTGDIAILVRSRSHILSILPALRDAGISYQAIEIDLLKDQQHILDLLALTRAILHAADRTSWLACLRAPWCGLILSDLAALVEKEPDRTVPNLLSDPEAIGRLSPDGRTRAIRMGEILLTAMQRIGHMPLRELIEQAWLLLGGPAVLRGANQAEDAEIFWGLLQMFEEGGTIRDFSLLSERLQHLYAKPNREECCVQVMTVHQAKGLEFDTVILPQLARWPRADAQELLICNQAVEEDGTHSLRIAALPRRGEDDPEYESIREQLKEKNKNEAKRLFYVACTRAKNRLFLLGSTETKGKGKAVADPRDGTFLRMIWDAYKPQFESLLSQRAPARTEYLEEEPETATAANLLHRLPASWRLPQLERSVQWQPELQYETASTRHIRYDWVSGTGRRVGMVVHEILKRAIPNEAGLRSIIRSELRRLGVSSAEEAQAVKQAARAVKNAMSGERGRWIFGTHAEARWAWPVAGRVGGKLVSGTIDRSFRDEDGRLWVIDFKVSEHLGGDLQTFLTAEQQRYRQQMENYAALLSRLTPGPIRLGLYFPLLRGWREWEFTEEIATASH
jgi:ATP-dependent exoDNAse (exonuclease V) beta subunit